MKKVNMSVVLLIFTVAGLPAQENQGVSFGIHFLAGGRYDNVRMCVGSPPGVPGGPIGELYVDVRVPVNSNGALIFNIPVFRPVFFAAAFKMVQIEPLVTYEYTLGGESGTRPVVGGGGGMVFHYGPDYNSSAENPGDSFFSIGPTIHGFAGLTIGESNFSSGVRGFFSPLFTSGRPTGVVTGGGIELHYDF